MMERIWANRLEAGDQVWSSVPLFRKDKVRQIMQEDVRKGIISAERYREICGENYSKQEMIK